MGIFDTYCAICGCSLEGATIGSNAPSALRWRHARVARKRQERESGEFDPDAYSDEEEVVEYGDDAVDEVWYPQDEGRSYDPTLVTLESMSWLEESYCLAVNPQAPGGPAAYISGKAVIYENSDVSVQAGTDPNEPPGVEPHRHLSCYSFIGPAAFPFHPCCFSILTDVLTGSTDVAKVDKDALYGAMSERVIHYRSFLELDYGEISGIDQTWESIAGEEFSVTNPGTTPEITNLLVHCLADGRFQARSDSLKIDREIPVQDPFAGLPVEILHTILRFLSGDTLISLRRASWAVFCMTRHNSFWKWFLKHEMAWLTELRPLLSDPRPGPEPSYRALYLWLDKATAPRYGVEGPFMALANRRRIWSVCEQLSPHYFRQLQVPQQQPDYNMLQEATCRHLALISGVDQPSQSWDVQRTLFAYSQDEMKNKLFFFSVYWAEGHRLAGLSVTVDKENRTFGLTDDNMPHLTRTTMCLALGEYITAIILTLQTTDPNKHATASPYVVRMEVHTQRDGVTVLEPNNDADIPRLPCRSQTRLQVSAGTCLVGITGHIDPHDTIHTLGLLEAPIPPSPSNPTPFSTAPPSPLPREPRPNCCRRGAHRFWATPTPQGRMSCGSDGGVGRTDEGRVEYRAVAVAGARFGSGSGSGPGPGPRGVSVESVVSAHLVPHEAFVFAADRVLRGKLERVVVYLGPGDGNGDGDGSAGGGGLDLRTAVVHGFRAEYIRRFWHPKQYAGLRRNVSEWDAPPAWPGERVVFLEVDGPRGEVIDEVFVCEGKGGTLGLRITTNWGSEVCVGDQGAEGWTSQCAPRGEAIVGFITGFTGKTNHPGYGGLSSLAILTGPE